MSTRGQRLYDRWSRRDRAFSLLYGAVFLGREDAFRRRTVDALDLAPGDRVLEVGCGPGNSLARLRGGVGPSGEVVALDYSRGMVDRAADRVAAAGWENVRVVRGDATRVPVADGSVDAALAAMSLSATADPRAAVAELARCLAPDGRLAVLDTRPFTRRPWTLLTPVVVPLARLLTDWRPEVDVVDAVRGAFGTVTVDAATGGAVVVVAATDPVRGVPGPQP